VRPLSAKQIAFADFILKGSTGSDAYRGAYNTRGSTRAVARKAVDLVAHKGVRVYMATERAKQDKAKMLDRAKSLELLAGIAQSPKATNRDKISAIERTAKMCGYDAPEKMELKVEGSLLYRIRKGKR